MNNKLNNDNQIPVDALVPEFLVPPLSSDNAGCEELVKQAKEHIEKCRDVLLRAKEAVPKHLLRNWLADNFEGSDRSACCEIVYDALELDDQALVIPPLGSSLWFTINFCEGGMALCIEPANREDYYYVTGLEWDHDDGECTSQARGPIEPIRSDKIWETCRRFHLDDLVHISNRTELMSAPLAFNRWQFDRPVQQPSSC